MINIGNILVLMKQSESDSHLSDFVNHLYDYRPNWTPLSPFTIIN